MSKITGAILNVVETGRLYSMKETCAQTGLAYETLKFYCNSGLVPNVKRDANNRRVFNDRDIAWIRSLVCLKNCDMTIAEMKSYLAFCLHGQTSIPKRKVMLRKKRDLLLKKQAEIQAAIEYIDLKEEFYDDVLSGKTPYRSNLLPTDDH